MTEHMTPSSTVAELRSDLDCAVAELDGLIDHAPMVPLRRPYLACLRQAMADVHRALAKLHEAETYLEDK